MILIKASMMKRTLNGISESFTSLFLPWSASFVGSVRARKVQLRMMAEMIAASKIVLSQILMHAWRNLLLLVKRPREYSQYTFLTFGRSLVEVE